jgi:acylphosphatase
VIRHYLVRGRVQGVGYRYFVRRTALQLTLTGWVRNLDSGDVEVLARGQALDLETFAQALWERHPFARVTDVEMTEISDEGQPLTSFDIVG